jgi:hypothetical protein
MYLFAVLSYGGGKPLDEKRRELSDDRPVSRAGLIHPGVPVLGFARRPGRYLRLADEEYLVPFLPQSATATPTCPDAPGERA